MRRPGGPAVNIGFLTLLLMILFAPAAGAVVGQAEGLDEFVVEDLEEYHGTVLNESRFEEMLRDDDEGYAQMLQRKETELAKEDREEVRELLEEEINVLKGQLLDLPERDRFQVELRGDYTYDSNIERRVPRDEKGDSVFNVIATGLVDLSGKKTDLRMELSGQREWNWVFSEDDFYHVEERIRYRRRYFKKLAQSFSSRVARNSSKTSEIDEKKIRWDFHNTSAFNLAFSRKLSLNMELNSTKRLFRTEAFDQDSSWEVNLGPSAFWNITPKSRIQAGYKFGANRSRIKSGDTNAHDINIGYFGQVTKKSSTSFTFAYQHQTPRSRDTAESDLVTVGLGYIWQATPKSQITFQYLRSLQNSTSNLTSGSVDGTNTTERNDTHFSSDNISVSLNSRILKKVTAVLTLNATHNQTKTFVDGDKDTETRQFLFPLSLRLVYALRQWLTFDVGYSYAFRTGNEKADTFRTHIWTAAVRMIF